MSRDRLNGLNGRRRFLGVLGSGTLGWWFSRPESFWRGETFVPVAKAQQATPSAPLVPLAIDGMEGKDGLIVLSDRPLTAETPVTLLDDELTPNSRHFIRTTGFSRSAPVRVTSPTGR